MIHFFTDTRENKKIASVNILPEKGRQDEETKRKRKTEGVGDKREKAGTAHCAEDKIISITNQN